MDAERALAVIDQWLANRPTDDRWQWLNTAPSIHCFRDSTGQVSWWTCLIRLDVIAPAIVAFGSSPDSALSELARRVVER